MELFPGLDKPRMVNQKSLIYKYNETHLKIYLVCFLFIVSCSTKKSEPSAFYQPSTDLKLVELKPVKPQNSKPLGTIYAELSGANGTIVEKQSSLGDCKKCVRGFGVKEKIGVRLEGKDLKNLTIVHKQSPEVKIVDCIQRQLVNGHFDCKFSINNDLYTLKLSVK